MILYCHPDVLGQIRPPPEGTPVFVDVNTERQDAGDTRVSYCKNCGAIKKEHTSEDPSA